MLIQFILIFLSLAVLTRGDKQQQRLSTRETYGAKMYSYMDPSVNPCEDFYKYSCGNYFKVNKVKEGLRFGSIFSFTKINIIEDMHQLLSEESVNETRSLLGKTKAIYQACMKTNIFDLQKSDIYLKLIESLGGWPVLDPEWNAEDFDWFETITKLKEYGVDIIVKESVSGPVIEIEPELFGLIRLNGANINRPNSRFYQANKKIAIKIMTIYGATEEAASRAFQEIIAFGKEITIAESVSRIYEETVTRHTIKSLDSFEPLTYDWQSYFTTIFGENANTSTEILVKSEDYFKFIPMAFRQKYLRGAANYIFLKFLYTMHSEFRFPKYHKRFCFEHTEEQMEPFLTVFYIRSKYHSTNSRDGISNIMSYIMNASNDGIKSSDWMDEDTKEKALRKLHAMEYLFTDDNVDLDEIGRKCCLELEVHSDDYFGNNLRVKKHKQKVLHRYFISGFDNDMTDVLLLPLKVNAFYANSNKIFIFPGIMRMPFYDADLPMVHNFASIGRILGHEITHGFDYDGRKLDENGEDVDWWSPESADRYEERAKCFVEQYNKYRVPEIDAYLDGEKTLEENIADNGGLRQAFQAYNNWLNDHPELIAYETLPELNFTNSQLFFISYAQTFCEKMGYFGYKLILNDKHAPNQFRLIGTLHNFDKFSETFKCDLGTPMNPVRKCILW